jgi:glycosyltransferase involved in cell wall biosynthesis
LARIVITRFESLSQPDGINIFIWHLSTVLSHWGHEVFVVGPFKEQKVVIERNFGVEIPGINIVQLSTNDIYSKNTFYLWSLWTRRGMNVLNKFHPEMIIMNGAVPLFNIKSNMKLTVNHDLEKRYKFQRYYEFITYRLFDYVVTTTPELRNMLHCLYKLKFSKIKLIPVGICLENYHARRLDEREHAILHVGTRRSKNLQFSIDVLKLILKSDPDIKLYITGPPSSYLNNILSCLNDKIKKKVKYLGSVSSLELRQIFSNVKLTLVPSTYHVPVISPTVLESFACGTPVLSFSKAISSSLLIDGFNGFRVEPTNLRLAGHYVLKILSDNEIWRNFSQNALAHIKKFDITKIAHEYILLLKESKRSS